MRKSKRMPLTAAFTLFLYFVMLTQPLFSTTIDNYGAAMQIGKCFGSDSAFLYISPAYCKLMGFLSELLPHASVFMLVQRLLVLLAMWALSDLISEKCEPVQAILLHLGLVGVYGLLNLYNANYTVWTGFFMTVGWLLTASVQASGEKRLSRRIQGILFAAAGCALRIQAVLIIVPFMLLDMLLRAWNATGEGLAKRLKRTALLLLPILLLVAAAEIEIHCVYVTGEYASEYAYNEARMAVVDYPMKDYAELENPPFSENDYECVTHWILMDTEIVTQEYLEQMHEVGGEGIDYSPETVISRLKGVYRSMGEQTILFAAMLVLSASLFFRKGSIQKLRTAFSLIGAGMIAVYLCGKGRIVPRVVSVIGLGILGNLFSAIVNDGTAFKRPARMLAAVLAAALCLCSAKIIVRDAGKMQSAFDAKTVSQTEQEDDTVIIWDVMQCNSDSPLTRPFTENPSRIPNQAVTNHHTSTGDVSNGQKSYYQQLSRMGIQNPMRALIEREHTYLAAAEITANRVLTWLREHYNANTQMEAIGIQGNAVIWRYTI